MQQERVLHEMGRVLSEVRGRWCPMKEVGRSEMSSVK